MSSQCKTTSAMKRLYKEANEMRDSKDNDFHAEPLGDNLFEWHYTIRGESDSDFSGGIYHGRIIFPSEYPLKPPQFVMTTPNGVFSVDEKICLSISDHHPEMWSPSWSIRTALIALRSFMPRCPPGTLGSITSDPFTKKALAKKSINFTCSVCGKCNAEMLSVSSEKQKEGTNASSNDQQCIVPAPVRIQRPSPPTNADRPVYGFFRFAIGCFIFYWLLKFIYVFTYPKSTFSNDLHTYSYEL